VREARPNADLLTGRLVLCRPSRGDLSELFAIESDPRVWRHYPVLRHADPSQTLAVIDRWLEGWSAHGLDTWTVRLDASPALVGYGGCSVRGEVWNLGYRLSPSVQGRGLATELATAAMRRAIAVGPTRPIIARLLEHNTASQRVAVKLGMELAHRGPDAGNPNSAAMRLIYSDRPLTTAQLSRIVDRDDVTKEPRGGGSSPKAHYICRE
jgi:RimJ/RimL family protein N-acetyltransferase